MTWPRGRGLPRSIGGALSSIPRQRTTGGVRWLEDPHLPEGDSHRQTEGRQAEPDETVPATTVPLEDREPVGAVVMVEVGHVVGRAEHVQHQHETVDPE